MNIKTSVKKLFSFFKLEVGYALDSGFSIFGFNIKRSLYPYSKRSSVALEKCLSKNPKTVLDVGSGGGEHAVAFKENGADVTCIDYGVSVYATNSSSNAKLVTIKTDFLAWNNLSKYELVWASHVLEHQRNVGTFVEKIIECCQPDGLIAITVPVPHRRLWGGHVSLWSPGLLAYNIVLCGVDLRDAEIFYGYREVSIIFTPKLVSLPALTFDSGDLLLLKDFLPYGFSENTDPWI